MAHIVQMIEDEKEVKHIITKLKSKYLLDMLKEVEETVRANHHNMHREECIDTAVRLARLGFPYLANLIFDSSREREALTRELGPDYFKVDEF